MFRFISLTFKSSIDNLSFNVIYASHVKVLTCYCSKDLRNYGITKRTLHAKLSRSSNTQYNNIVDLHDVPPARLTADNKINKISDEHMKVIKLEYEVLKQSGYEVPDTISDENWLEIYHMKTFSARLRIYRKLLRIESEEISSAQTKLEQQALVEESNLERNELFKNTFYHYIRKSTMNMFQYAKLAHAMLSELPIVIDLSYEEFMNDKELKLLCTEIHFAHGKNKEDVLPFHFLMTGAKEGRFMDIMHNNVKTFKVPLKDAMYTITRKSYLDIFPREQLVYLSPNAHRVMDKFCHDKVYIVGGLVDKSASLPRTLAQAKEHGIVCEKLPLDHYLRWHQGSKSLSLDQVIMILLDLKSGKDWMTALRHVPWYRLKPESIPRGYYPYTPEAEIKDIHYKPIKHFRQRLKRF